MKVQLSVGSLGRPTMVSGRELEKWEAGGLRASSTGGGVDSPALAARGGGGISAASVCA